MGVLVSRYVFFPPSPTYQTTDVTYFLRGRQGKIAVYRYDHPTTPTDLTVVYSHGNAEDIGGIMRMAPRVSALMQANIVAYDYPGYGCSEGKPSESAAYDAARTVLADLHNVRQVPPHRTILYAGHCYLVFAFRHRKSDGVRRSSFGRSLGTGVTVEVAASPPSSPYLGVVLQSPLASAFRVGIGRTLPGDLFTNIDKVHKIQSHVQIIHGRRDEVVPFEHGTTLYEKLRHPRPALWIDHAGHNDIELAHWPRFAQCLQDFAAFLLQAGPAAAAAAAAATDAADGDSGTRVSLSRPR